MYMNTLTSKRNKPKGPLPGIVQSFTLTVFWVFQALLDGTSLLYGIFGIVSDLNI